MERSKLASFGVQKIWTIRFIGVHVESIVHAFERFVLRGLAALQKLSILKATEHHGMKKET